MPPRGPRAQVDGARPQATTQVTLPKEGCTLPVVHLPWSFPWSPLLPPERRPTTAHIRNPSHPQCPCFLSPVPLLPYFLLSRAGPTAPLQRPCPETVLQSLHLLEGDRGGEGRSGELSTGGPRGAQDWSEAGLWRFSSCPRLTTPTPPNRLGLPHYSIPFSVWKTLLPLSHTANSYPSLNTPPL